MYVCTGWGARLRAARSGGWTRRRYRSAEGGSMGGWVWVGGKCVCVCVCSVRVKARVRVFASSCAAWRKWFPWV